MTKEELITEHMLTTIRRKYPRTSHFRHTPNGWWYDIMDMSGQHRLEPINLHTSSHDQAVKNLYKEGNQ